MSQSKPLGAAPPRPITLTRSKKTQTEETPKTPEGSSETSADEGGDSVEAPRATSAQRDTARRAFNADRNVGQLRAQLDAQLDGKPAPHRGQHGDHDHGRAEGFGPMPPHTPGVYTPYPQGKLTEAGGNVMGMPIPGATVIEGTDGNDEWRVSSDARTGDVVISRPDGWERRVKPEDAQNGIIIRTKGGDDKVTIEPGVLPHIQVEGGDGNDVIDASQATGQVILDGGAGDDVIKGGHASDLLIGGDGHDKISGGNGNDEIDAGAGNDSIDGGGGGDQLRGGAGNDKIAGGEGSDFIQAGAGADKVDGGTGADAIYVDEKDAVNAGQVAGMNDDGANDFIIGTNGTARPSSMGATDTFRTYDPAAVDAYLDANKDVIRIDGDPDTIARTKADLGVLLGTEQGKGVLAALTEKYRADGETLSIGEERRPGPGGQFIQGGAIPFGGPKSDRVTVGNWAGGTLAQPVPILHHELIHAYQHQIGPWPEGQTVFGTPPREVGINNVERQAVGLPYIAKDGTLRPANELPFTENLLRQELGLPPRPSYGNETGAPVKWRAKPPPPQFPPGPFPGPLRPGPLRPGPFPGPLRPGPAPGPLGPLGPNPGPVDPNRPGTPNPFPFPPPTEEN